MFTSLAGSHETSRRNCSAVLELHKGLCKPAESWRAAILHDVDAANSSLAAELYCKLKRQTPFKG